MNAELRRAISLPIGEMTPAARSVLWKTIVLATGMCMCVMALGAFVTYLFI